MSINVVTGTPGAGKTTVLGGALKRLSKFTVLNYGDEMFSYAKKKGIVKDRDELRKQSPETQRSIQRMAAREISAKSRESQVIVDTHCTVKTPSGYLPGLPQWVLEELKPETIILVEAEAEEILGRRNLDVSRDRDKELAGAIQEHQEINRAVAMAYAMISGATVKIVKNHDGMLDEAVMQMVEALK